MAYAEKRGKGPKPWRVRYKRPDGTDGSEPGFETKKEALTWGREQESRISAGQWTDPDAGKILVRTWIERWLQAQDVGLSTDRHPRLPDPPVHRPASGDTANSDRSAARRSTAGRKRSRPGTASPAARPRMPAACWARSWATPSRPSPRC